MGLHFFWSLNGKSNLFLKILTSPWRSHGCPQRLSFLYKELQGLMHQRQTLKTKKAKPNQDVFKSLIDEGLGPPCSWSFTAVFVATLKANKNIFMFVTCLFWVSHVDAVIWETDPVPSECPHRQTSPPLLCTFTQWYRWRASLVSPASLGSPVESPNPQRGKHQPLMQRDVPKF